jgi:hypothetical protein
MISESLSNLEESTRIICGGGEEEALDKERWRRRKAEMTHL